MKNINSEVSVALITGWDDASGSVQRGLKRGKNHINLSSFLQIQD